ncbi:MAG: tetratricopeptide repeat protein [Betaproteobacteria bacterium]
MLRWLRNKTETVASTDLGALVQEGLSRQQMGDLAAARACYEEILRIDRRNLDASYLLGTVELASGAVELALERFEQVLRVDPANAACHYSRGEALRFDHRLPEAVDAFRAALVLEATDPEWWNELGRTLDALDRVDEAGDCYAEAARLAPAFAPGACNLGNARLRQGRRDEARAAFEQAVAHAPDFMPAVFGLGSILQAEGHLAEAAARYQQALALAPGQAEVLTNLGAVLLGQDRPEAAERALRAALESEPRSTEAWINLGAALRALDRLDEAQVAYARAIESAPAFAPARLQHAIALELLGRIHDAERELNEAIAIDPGLAEAHCRLGNILGRQGFLDEAEQAWRRALEIEPEHIEVLINLGDSLNRSGRVDEAVALTERLVAAHPDLAVGRLNLGVFLLGTPRHPKAEDCFRKALELDPELASAHVMLAALYLGQARLSEAEAEARAALDAPGQALGAWVNLGNALQHQGRLSEAIEAARRAIAIDPTHGQAWSNLLMTLQYRWETTDAELMQVQREFGERFDAPNPPDFAAHDRDPGRKLRIGYVSPDFRHHVVSFFFEPVLAAHDRSQVEIFCYYNHTLVDATTRRLRAASDYWRDIAPLNDEEVARIMRADRLDLAIDLAGHTAKNRLPVFGRRVAPVQATWLGFPGGTGLASMDWRVTDARADPEGPAEDQHVERLLRLPETFIAYTPPRDAPDVADLRTDAIITFGAFNNFSKVTDPMLALWARILAAVPEAHLLVKAGSLKDPGTRERAAGRLARYGCDLARVTLTGTIPAYRDHLASWGAVDIALDTFPYHGTTTTCEALWMGVPVVTLAGDRHAARVGVSLLEGLGLADLVAGTADEYVAVAVRLAQDRRRREELRRTLRDTMASAPLLNVARFTRSLETGYRSIWQDWLARC